MTGTYPLSCRLGYARVSTYDQTVDAQLDQLRAKGCGMIYREKATRAPPDRRELQRMLRAVAPGDVVTVTRIDRLARSNIDLFGAWRVVREWGRIWAARQTGTVPNPTPRDAETALERQRRVKERRGYV